MTRSIRARTFASIVLLIGAASCRSDATSAPSDRTNASAPGAPLAVSAQPGPSVGAITLSWQDTAFASSHTVYRSAATPFSRATATPIHVGASPYVDTALVAGHEYSYAVTGTKDGVESALSDVASATAHGGILLRILSPTSSFADSTVAISASVTSTFEPASVTARVGASVVALVYASADRTWNGSLSLAGLPSPSLQQIVVTAYDVRGDSAVATIGVRYDRPPAITLGVANGTVATPSFHLAASCTDDSPAGCARLTARVVAGALIDSGSTRLDRDVSLAAYDGQQVTIEVDAADAAGRTSSASAAVFVDASTHLTPVADAGSGVLLDATADRLLVADVDADGQPIARIVDRATGASTRIGPLARTMSTGTLFAGGAIMGSATPKQLTQLVYEWRQGALTSTEVRAYRNGGAYWIWAPVNVASFVRRDVGAGQTATLTDPLLTYCDVGPDGDVVCGLLNSAKIVRARGAQLAERDTLTTFATPWTPITDGINVIYATDTDIALIGADSSQILATGLGTVAVAHHEYVASGGWAAFVRPATADIRQIFLHSPAGAIDQITSFGASSWIEALSPAGEVVFVTPASITSTTPRRRYRASAGTAPVGISSALGQPLYLNGVLHVMIGKTLFRVN